MLRTMKRLIALSLGIALPVEAHLRRSPMGNEGGKFYKSRKRITDGNQINTKERWLCQVRALVS